MSPLGRIAPALNWRAFFACSCALAAPAGAAVPTKSGELAQIGLPDAAEARQILDRFRRAGIAGQYYLEFELRGLPRRGDEVVYVGRLWGGRNDQGAISRLEVTDAAGQTSRLLVQNGERPAVWRFARPGVTEVDLAGAFQPLIPGLEITAFDLQMPFLYWPEASLERLTNVLGRPAYTYLFRAPPAIVAHQPELRNIRAYFDTQFNALMRIEYLSATAAIKSIGLLNFRKVGEQYIPKSFDVRNEVSRDKTRFVVTGAALNLDLSPAVFVPDALAEPIPAPAGLVRISP